MHVLDRKIAASICLLITIASAALADQKVRFVVHVPPASPQPDYIYVAGSLPAVGSWKPDGLKLTRQSSGVYQADVDLPIGQTLEFKFTRGTWAAVEQNAAGTDRSNRRVVVDASVHQIDAKVERWATSNPSEPPASTVVGNLKCHKLDSKALAGPRAIRVWLPPGYDANSKTGYSILYMHDGQNCFDRATSAFGNEWQIDETLTKLIKQKRIPPLIVVGIDNGLANRINELTYSSDPKRGGGNADQYAKFLLTEVKPFVDKTYRTQSDPSHTFLGGSSLGGLMSLEIARRHPNTFGGILVMSPTLWWNHGSVIDEVANAPAGLSGTRVWLDMGTREGATTSKTASHSTEAEDNLTAVKRLGDALSKQHIEHRLTIDADHPEHNESAWAARFPQAIEYLLNEK